MSNEKAVEYIKTGLKRNIPEETIISNLKSKNWSQEVIDTCMKEAKDSLFKENFEKKIFQEPVKEPKEENNNKKIAIVIILIIIVLVGGGIALAYFDNESTPNIAEAENILEEEIQEGGEDIIEEELEDKTNRIVIDDKLVCDTQDCFFETSENCKSSFMEFEQKANFFGLNIITTYELDLYETQSLCRLDINVNNQNFEIEQEIKDNLPQEELELLELQLELMKQESVNNIHNLYGSCEFNNILTLQSYLQDFFDGKLEQGDIFTSNTKSTFEYETYCFGPIYNN